MGVTRRFRGKKNSTRVPIFDMVFHSDDVKPREGRRIIDKLTDAPKPTLSLEFFPPKTPEGLESLHSKLQSMADMNPVWIDVTFGAGGSTAGSTLSICEIATRDYGLDVMMHLTCTNMKLADIDSLLDRAKAAGIRNIMALRGDPPLHTDEWVQCEGGFAHAIDLVRHIKKTHGDYFCIGVAGYPEGHIDAASREADWNHLKEKVDEGADLIVTQLFYDFEKFNEFKDYCDNILKIKIPIITGIMPILNYNSFNRITTFCKASVPVGLRIELDSLKENDEKFVEFSENYLINEIILKIKDSNYIHLYTMNNENAIRGIVKRLDMFLPHCHLEWI
jgi:methylenetetrahydrofolate reductase (NADPH)